MFISSVSFFEPALQQSGYRVGRYVMVERPRLWNAGVGARGQCARPPASYRGTGGRCPGAHLLLLLLLLPTTCPLFTLPTCTQAFCPEVAQLPSPSPAFTYITCPLFQLRSCSNQWLPCFALSSICPIFKVIPLQILQYYFKTNVLTSAAMVTVCYCWISNQGE